METLFEEMPREVVLGEGAVLLGGFALADEDVVLAAVAQVSAAAPFRQMVTPGGHTMSVAMTNCGTYGWVTDARGYRYATQDPLTGKAWPEMPEALQALALRAAAQAGYAEFRPDACLMNRYAVGAKMGLHQDRDERDLGAPIVSVSLGIPAVFQFGGLTRADPVQKVRLVHGDVVVWGGRSRLNYHGILPLKEAVHGRLGAVRVNLTFRVTT